MPFPVPIERLPRLRWPRKKGRDDISAGMGHEAWQRIVLSASETDSEIARITTLQLLCYYNHLFNYLHS